MYGQHTSEVLTGTLGRSEQELVDLRDWGSTQHTAGGLVEMAVTLCVPPRAGEPCAPVRFLVRQDWVVMELTARHRITGVEWDEGQRAVAMLVDITDPQTARPWTCASTHWQSRPPGRRRAMPRTTRSTITRDGRHYEVVGTYLGVVADEN